MIPIRDISIIQSGDRLFYELGYKYNIDLGYGDNWIRTGQFKEIENIMEYIEGDTYLNNIKYLEHHNFMLIKNNK
jgi:hypothetical protein